MTRTSRASSIIWKTVVSAGAMLGGACAKAPPAAEPVAAAPAPPVEPTPPAPPPAPEPAPVAEAPAPPPAPEPPPPPVMITVQVVSKPAGADVYLDDKLVGKTPLRLEVPQSSTEMNLKVTRKGYSDQLVSFTAEADQALEVKLEKPAKRPRGLGTIGVGQGGGGTGKGVGRGFILS